MASTLTPILAEFFSWLRSFGPLAPLELASKLSANEWKALAVIVPTSYLALCSALRFQREKSMRRKYGFHDRESLRKMTVEEAHLIVKYLTSLEFPMFVASSLEFGLFKTYAIESISKMLLATQNLTHPANSPKRYEDTSIIIGEFLSHPPGSGRSVAAIARMNWLHSKYQATGQISNADLLYTLSVFILEPERFVRLYEWRELNDMEICAFGVFWKGIGDAMGIRFGDELPKSEWVDGLDFVKDVKKWAKDYEVEKAKPSTVSHRPAVTLIPMMTYWVPGFATPFVQECVTVLLGDRARDAFMLPEPGIISTAVVYTSLVVRRFVLRYLCLPRVVAVAKHRGDPEATDKPIYLKGYYGNYPFYTKPTLWNRWSPKAWLIWLAGGVLPGDQPEEYLPQGFTFDMLGPKNKMGQGKDEMAADVKRMKQSDMRGCPFR